MKAIQSFWILPGDKNAGSWISKKYEFMSWSLSYFLLKKNFGKVALQANIAGASMLTDTLGLDYDEVKTDLEDQTDLLKAVWGLGKMYTYATQNEPFVHVDSDAFWFNIPEKPFFEAELFAQSLEMDDPAYKNIWLNSHKYAHNIPACMTTPYSRLAMAANTGIVGGSNYTIFKPFYSEALEFVHSNRPVFKDNPEAFRFISIYVEQALFLSYIDAQNTKIAFLKKPVFRTNFEEVTDFNSINSETHTPDFIHLLATYKYKVHHCNLMEFWLYKTWPEQLEKIDRLCSENEELSKNFRILLDPVNEKRLPIAERIFMKPEDVLHHPYIRLSELLGDAAEKLDDNEITALVNKCADPEKATDCYHFEKNRQKVLQHILEITNPGNLYDHFEVHLDFCSKSVDDVMSYRISLNHSRALKSKYNWFNDLEYSSGHYWYTMAVSSDKLCFQELVLPENSCHIMDMLKEEMTIQELISLTASNDQKKMDMLIKTLKEFVGIDLIKVKP